MLLNLGCGTKTCNMPGVVNIDWSIYLRVKNAKLLKPFIPLFISGERKRRLNLLPENIMVHNLSKGLPFSANSVDVVYHSHMLEHLDRDVTEKFLAEVLRVLKPGGIHRIVVPDLEVACKAYIAHLEKCDLDAEEVRLHDGYVASLLEQSVRKEAYSTRRQKALRRFIENRVLGDARKRGETHQWMYDRVNLSAMLKSVGYTDVQRQEFNSSLIPNWADYGLDTDDDGKQYKPGSLYLEARK